MPRDPFRAWIQQQGRRAVAERVGVAKQAVDKWASGGGVTPARMADVKRQAKKDGVVLATDHLLPRVI